MSEVKWTTLFDKSSTHVKIKIKLYYFDARKRLNNTSFKGFKKKQ